MDLKNKKKYIERSYVSFSFSSKIITVNQFYSKIKVNNHSQVSFTMQFKSKSTQGAPIQIKSHSISILGVKAFNGQLQNIPASTSINRGHGCFHFHKKSLTTTVTQKIKALVPLKVLSFFSSNCSV